MRPGVWRRPPIESEREPRPPRPGPGPGRRLLVATFAFVLAAGAIAFAARAFPRDRTQPAEPTTPTESPSATPTPIIPVEVDAVVTHTIEVGPFSEGIAIGEGGVWVASTHDGGTGPGDIVRIDPQTGEIVDTIPVGSLPGWEWGGGGIAVGQGSVWVLGAERIDGDIRAIVQQIDPSTNSVVDVIELGMGSSAGDVWVDETGIWAVYLTLRGNTVEVAHADLNTHELISTFTVPGEWSQTIFAAGGYLWVAALVTGTDGAFFGEGSEAYLDRIDPVTGNVEIAARTEGSWSFPAPGGSPWVKVEGGVQRFDFASGSMSGDPIEITMGVTEPTLTCCSGPFVSDGEGGAWIANLRGPLEGRGLWHVNANGAVDRFVDAGRAQEVRAWEGIASGFDPTTSSLWVVQGEETVSRIQIG